MPVIFENDFVLTDSTPEFPVTLDHPVVGYHNLVTATNIVADTADANYPASNLANPATHSEAEWRAADTTAQEITITTGYVDDIDYVGIARHNFADAEVTVAVGYYDETDTWVELIAEFMPGTNSPLLLRFTAQSIAEPVIRLGAGSLAPRAAVVYVGKLLTLERRIYVGHTPLPTARKNEIQNGRSESGNFLGRILLGAWRESTIPLSLLSPGWYRDHGGDDFLAAAATTPFFFGWRPESYPYEVGYCWTTEDPMPVPVGPSNKLAFDIKVTGIA